MSSSMHQSKVSRIFVVGGGKAGGLMTRAIESILGNRIDDGIVNVMKGTERVVKTNHVELWGASHPIPCAEGEKGIDKMLDMTNGLTKNDLVITLISGGGSALMPYPASGISLTDLQETTNLLLRSGADINEFAVLHNVNASINATDNSIRQSRYFLVASIAFLYRFTLRGWFVFHTYPS